MEAKSKNYNKRKADCTSEEWERHLARMRCYNAKYRAEGRVKTKRNTSPEEWAVIGPLRVAHTQKHQQKNPPLRKDNATPEQWAERLARERAYAHSDKGKAAIARYKNKPEVRARDEQLNRSRLRQKVSCMPPEMFSALMAFQDGKCAVCGGLFRKTPHADHDHAAKLPRGLLCDTCNFAEGLIRKSGLNPVDFGVRLQRYLAEPPAEAVRLVVG